MEAEELGGPASRPVVGKDDRIKLLNGVPAFGALPHETRDEIAGLMEEERFSAGQVVVTEGDIGDRLFLVAEGTAEAWTDANGRHVTLTRLAFGDLFGELALLFPHSRRQATVTATSRLLTLSLTEHAFDELVSRHPEVRKIFAAGARRMLLAKFVQVNLLYRLHFRNPRRERMFLASVAFLLAFSGVRGMALAIRHGRGPFRDVTPGGLHIHHLVWGILSLLGIGYAWLLQIGTGLDEKRKWNRTTAGLYGLGAALTLDEFALWLHLQDVYWTEEGRRSIDAVVVFGALLSVGLWGGPFFRAMLRYFVPGLRGKVSLR